MCGFVEGVDRGQITLFPALLDDYVFDDNPVQAAKAAMLERKPSRWLVSFAEAVIVGG